MRQRTSFETGAGQLLPGGSQPDPGSDGKHGARAARSLAAAAVYHPAAAGHDRCPHHKAGGGDKTGA